jgi:RNA polymerase sigma-70 factor, ECF subfamily
MIGANAPLCVAARCMKCEYTCCGRANAPQSAYIWAWPKRVARYLPPLVGQDTTHKMPPTIEAVLGVDDDFGARLVALIPNLRTFAKSLCRGRGDADDLTQESIANAWQARASFTPGTNLKAWLFVIQRNAFYSAHRRTWREVGRDDDAMQRIMVTHAPQHASAELTDLSRAMALLPDDQREALILVGAGGFTYKEAAVMRGCQTGTMKSRVSRARQAVATSITDLLPRHSGKPASAYMGIVRNLARLTGIEGASAMRVA